MTSPTPFASKHWIIAPRISAEQNQVLAEFDPLLRQLLVNRGYTTPAVARRYLEARPPSDTDPFLMTGMGITVERILAAIQRREKIIVYGDYDVDGVTATALLTLALRTAGASVIPYIPSRFEEGYGLNREALESLKQDGAHLVITVDNGIRSLEEAEVARRVGLDLIITDHHQPHAETPDCLAIIDPKMPGDPYPDKNLCGVGVAYKLAEALTSRETGIQPEAYLDLVTLGTVADVVPLVGENRALVRRGLEQLRQPIRQGLYSLMGVADLKPARISTVHIGFMLAPRINAAGRIESALAALDLLMTDDVMEAGRLAQQLNLQNQERQRLTREIQAQAEEIAFRNDPHALLLFAAHPDFNTGVVGLAASRLSETYYRPAIVGSQGEEVTRASCRSIEEFHITQALDECADLLVRHGGHAAAAGLTVRNENLPELIQRLQEIAARELADRDLRPTLHADMEIPLGAIRPKETLASMRLLEPTGEDNPEAMFVSRNVQVRRSRCVGNDSRHLKLTLADGGIIYDAIAFGLGHLQESLADRVDILYTLGVNEYNGTTSLQLEVKDIQPAT
jgi:single-stranded-DNA-specific exonuclease